MEHIFITVGCYDTLIMDTYYIEHYFNLKNAGSFLLVSFSGLFAVLAVMLLFAKEKQKKKRRNMSQEYIISDMKENGTRPVRIAESFYELVFSSSSVLFFLALYYLIDEYVPSISGFWTEYRDLILLVFIVLSVFMTNWFDIILVRLTHIKEDQKVSLRLLSTFYIIFILLYIRFIYQDTNYNSLIIYFISLAIGRFVYFDFTLKEFRNTMKGLAANVPLLLLLLAYSALICWYGFKNGFLLTSNGVIVSILIAHLFMDLSIVVLHKTKLLHLFL